MTDGILRTIASVTGDVVTTCPWRSLFDPFVVRVQQAMRSFKSGNLAATHPNISHRHMQGIIHFDAVRDIVETHFMRLRSRS
jgi:hypothetical protein